MIFVVDPNEKPRLIRALEAAGGMTETVVFDEPWRRSLGGGPAVVKSKKDILRSLGGEAVRQAVILAGGEGDT